MTFVKLGMWLGGTVGDRFIITKHDSLVSQGNTQAAECVAQVDDLFKSGACGNKFRAMSGSLHGVLLFFEYQSTGNWLKR